ncbi:MAG TPA: hypothetical protein VNA57_10035 [Acidimicrobiales bacterium]|nr:hypothetical protein [Acidimicrobiales bacterium]
MTDPTRFCTQLRTFIDEALAGLDDIEVRQRPFQPVPAKLTPPRSDGAKAQFGHCHERYDPRSSADDSTSSLGVG